jgi:nitrite reductase/ring-hydroxylating ferredoxin subunit
MRRMTGRPTVVAARYERKIVASVARIWENVLDWEHLPWLHRTSFAAVRPLEERPDGWRAWVTTLPRGDRSLVEVFVERPRLRYVTRTVEGVGQGTEIRTVLEPVGEHETRIQVEFAIPPVDDARVAKIGAAYLKLYDRLWNEDETMMVVRQRRLDRGRLPGVNGAAIALGLVDDLRRRLPLEARLDGDEVRLVEVDGEIIAHAIVCPHLGGPLEAAPIVDGCVTCPWHGYRYDVRSGRCADHEELTLRIARVTIDADGNTTLSR